MPPPVHLGLDIAKLTLDISPHPALKQARYDNTPAGHRRLLRDLAKIPGVHVVCEAPGGYEQALLQTLHHARIPVSRLNPRLVRDYARARGRLAKTDAIDAAVLSDYGQRLHPEADPAPEPAHQRLAALVSRRRELQDLLQRERHRAEHHRDPYILKAAKSLRQRLEKDLLKLDAEIAAHQAASPELDRKIRRLTLVQGFGDTTARVLLAVLPNSAPWHAASATSPTAEPPSTWPPSSPPDTTPSSSPSINASAPRANLPNPPSPPSCANSPNSPTPSSKNQTSHSPFKTVATVREWCQSIVSF